MALAAKYNLNWNSTDNSWNWFNWTDNSMSYWNWINNGCWKFNWSNSYINCWDINAWTSNLTVIAWINRSWTIWDYTGIVSKWDWWGWNEFSLQFWWAWTSGVNKIAFEIQNWWTNTFLQNTSITIWTWVWYQIVWVFSPSTYQKIYINWLEVSTTSSTQAAFNNNANNCDIGRQYWLNSRIFNWNIDEVFIDSRIWSVADIKNNFALNKWFI